MKSVAEKILGGGQSYLLISSNNDGWVDFSKILAEIGRISPSDLIEFTAGDGVKILREKISSLNLRPHSSKYRVMLIFDADSLNKEEANTLLKTLEEPPPYAKIVLLCRSLSRILPTIKSRCHKIYFGSGDKLAGENKLLDIFLSGDFNYFLSHIKDVDSKDIPDMLKSMLAGLKGIGLSGKYLVFYKKCAQVYLRVTSTNASRKLALEELFVWWKSYNE